MATDSKWRKDLGFLEGLMFDPVAGGILGGLQGLMGIFQTNEQNSLIDDAVNNYEKMKITEDQMGRRQSEVKRMYGSMVDSMIGAGQYLNSDTARAMQNAKLTGQSVEAQLKQRMSDEQRNLQIDDQINKLKGSKKGLLEPIANTFGGALQGVFNATQLGMSMDSKEKEQDMIDFIMNPDKYKNRGVPTGVVNPVTGDEIFMPKKEDLSYVEKGFEEAFNSTSDGINRQDENAGQFLKTSSFLPNMQLLISKPKEDLMSIGEKMRKQRFNTFFGGGF